MELAKECVDNNLSKNPEDILVLWVSFSNLDKISHAMGPDSREAIDAIYRIDKNINDFIKFLYKKVSPKDVFITLTSDHGSMSIPEVIKDRGLPFARRLNAREMITNMNNVIEQKFGMANVFKQWEAPQFYVNYKVWNTINPTMQKKILDAAVTYLKPIPGIQNVWTNKELDQLAVTPMSFEYFFKKQRYFGLGGQINVQVQPYNLLTTYPMGTAHETPYNYDTHVPLIVYQKDTFENKSVVDKVWITQFANTLAHVLDVPQPSASNASVLPGLFMEEHK